jgi:hypothetical protein
MKYKGNIFSYFNLSGTLFCVFIAWASYCRYKNLQIIGLFAFFMFCVLKCAMFAKFKNDILEKDTPLLFKVSNHVFGIAFIIMDIFIFYVNR